MKKLTLGSLVAVGVGLAALLIPISAVGRNLINYVTLQTVSPAIPEKGYISIEGHATVKNPNEDRSALQCVGQHLGIYVEASKGRGLYATTKGSSGSADAIVAMADTPEGTAIRAYNPSGHGIVGFSDDLSGVTGVTKNGNSFGVFSSGNSGASGTKSFLIDDPTDPANYTLRHYSTEGPEPLNVYTGTVKTDGQGYATIQLPDYFEAINKNPRYQLTVVDEADSTDFVLAKVVRKASQNEFTIRTSKPKTEVCWRVEATRNDPWVQRYGAPVRQEKTERGKYFQPELYGMPQTASIFKPVAPLERPAAK